MKILHKSKRVAPPHPQVADIITKLLTTPNDNLPDVLGQINSWKWPRSDLNAWIKVLNKFDTILEDVIRDYDIDKLQAKAFTPLTKKTLCEMLRFERLLLENSTNRKMFSSYDRLNSLLFTSDLDVLVLTLHLLLRPSQQYSAQPAVTSALNISTPRLRSLAKRWPNLREYGVGLVDLASINGRPEVEALPSEAREVNYSFYRTDSNEKEKNDQTEMHGTDAPEALLSTPRKSSTAPPAAVNSAAVNVHIDQQSLESKEVMSLLADTVGRYSVPEDEKFELLCRIRSAAVLTKGKEAQREKLVIIRLLSIAIFGHTHIEAQAMSSLFLYEPDLIVHIAELLQLDRGVSMAVQTAAIAALDALARYRNKIQEVLTAINAGVNHGILMALVRKTIADVGSPDCKLPHSFVEALLSFVTYIASHSAGGNMVVGAGLIPLLIQIIGNKIPERLAVVSKTMQLVDNVLYSFTNAFQLFCGGHGVEALVDRIEHEVDLDIKEHGEEHKTRGLLGSYGELPVARAAVLKHTLRSMHRMMQSSGTAEGLRGLIDSSILKSLKKIIEHRALFGPSVVPIAINIMATFVHNEPTSLPIIQEAGLPEAFYKAIEAGLEPVIEVIQAIPNAIGALCLNQAGQDQLSGRPSIIPGIFAIFTSERHLKVLQDKENAVLIGTAMDELIRHHPSLKTPVFEAIKSTLSKIEDLGNAYVVPEDIQQWYKLVPVSASVHDEDVVMDIADSEGAEEMTATDSEQSGSTANDLTQLSGGEDPALRSHDNMVVSFIDVVGRFLEGLFQTTTHCRDFISTTDGLDRIGRLTALHCIPYDYANSLAIDSLVQVMRTMADVASNETLLYLQKLVIASLEETKEFWGSVDDESKLLPLLEITEEQEQEGNQRFRSLITLHIRIALLSDVFATAGYTHGRAAIGILQTLMGDPALDAVPDLGTLHRACILENILLKAGLTSKGIDSTTSPDASPLERSPSRASALAENDPSITTNGVQPEALNVEESSSMPKAEPAKLEGPREHNAKALRHLMHGLPSSLTPFFQAIVKLFHARRNPDTAQRKQIMSSSTAIADIMLKHISQKNFGDADDKLSVFAYLSVMLGTVTILLLDERTNQLHTVLLAAFYRAGGLDAIIQVCRMFMATIETVTNVEIGDRSEISKQELVHAYGGLKVALHLIYPLISSKPLHESPQTLLIASRDKKDTDPDYFEGHNFLVRLRLAALPLLKDLWEATWLVPAPLPVVKSVVQAVMELTGAENEEPKDEASGEVVGGPSPASAPRSAGPDENRIRQVTDMGFPRSAAERALARTHNNVSAATELLLSQPFPFPPDREANDSLSDVEASEEPSDETPPPNGERTAATDSEEEMQIGSSVAGPSSSGDDAPLAEPVAVVHEAGKSSEQWRKDLDEARRQLKAGMSKKALRLVDQHPSLIFDVYNAFTRPSDGLQEQSVRHLVDDIKAFSPFAHDVREEPLAMRCRLLALVLTDAPSALTRDIVGNLMDSLLALILSNPLSTEAEHPSVPKWLASHLLVTESLLTMGEQPRTIILPKENDSIVSESIAAGPPFLEARTIMFDFCLRLLAIPDLPRDDLLAVLRLFVLLTRDHNVACQFVQRDGIALLFGRLKSAPVSGSQSYIALILRHAIEGPSVLQNIMKQEIKRFFAQPRTRIIDVGSYVRHCNPMALRDPEIFNRVTHSLCQLQHPYASVHHVSLKSEAVSKPAEEIKEGIDSSDMQVDVSSTSNALDAASTETLDIVVHFLVSELMRTSKTSFESVPSSTSPWQPQDASTSKEEVIMDERTDEKGLSDSTDEAREHDRQIYSCFLMQCLTELLFSYDSCKIAFLSYSPKKRSQTPAKDGGTKHRTATLQFLLSELVSYGTLNPQPDSTSRNRHSLCNWAMSVIVALCVDSLSSPEVKDVTSDLVSVRKFVLEAVSRAIKELSPSESLDSRYGRLFALSDLCHRLLIVRFNAVARKPQDEAPTHIAKVMLEKNFVSTLTNALAEVDLNYPNVRGLVAAILRPLEHLTKIAIKMSRASDKSKDGAEGKVDSTGSLASDDDDRDNDNAADVEDDGREETPDLYRNSSLGMYGGEMEDVHYTPEDEMDEDEEDEDEDVEMDFGEETGSDDTSNTDEEDEEILEGGARESQEGWQDEDEEYEEDDIVQQDEDEDDEDGDEHEIGEDGDGEIIWQDIHAEGILPDDTGEDQDEEDEGHDIHVLHQDDDEPDIMSDEEDYRNEVGILNINEAGQASGDDIFGYGDAFVDGIPENAPQDGQPFFVPRRHRGVGGEDMQVFGRPRNVAVTPAEATTHPLLLDASAASNRTAAGQSRTSRRTQRVHAGTTHAELLQTISELIGGPTVQLFSHLVTRGRGGSGPETIRLDVPAGTLVNLERGLLQQRRPGVLSASLRVERAPRAGESRFEGREFEPMSTLQRWAEEVKILHGKFVSERVGKLGNHIILSLLPAAVEIAKEAKIKEERRREAEAKAEEEAAAKEKEETETAAAIAKQEVEEAARREAEETSRQDAAMDAHSEAQRAVVDDSAQAIDTEMVDASEAPSLPNEVQTDQTNAIPSTADNATSITSVVPSPSTSNVNVEPAGSSSNDAESSRSVDRVTVMIHGSPVDITDTGIDPTFLEALPDEMREEVLNQHVRDQRAARVERPPDSQISDEFLNALPPEIRAEIIQQERQEQARRRAEEAAPPGDNGPAAAPAEIDPASFIASLDPQLRQTVLLDSDDGFIQTLPSFMIAEAGAYREGSHAARRHLPTNVATRSGPVVRKLPPARDAIQLLDKGGVAVLVRLLFFPQVLKKNHLFKVLVNLCENTKTRTELFNLLLNILQDGTGDLAAVDKSFAQMSFRNSKAPNQQTPKAAGKQRAGSDFFSSLALPNIQNDANPELVAQRCLEALTFIVSSNELSSLFFLTEHEVPPGLRRAVSKKGKGKEKQMPQIHYPVVLLLGLLDRQSLLKTPSTMESVVGLLATVTRPLTSIKDGKTKDLEAMASTSEPSASALAAITTTTNDTDTDARPQETEVPGQPMLSTIPAAHHTPNNGDGPGAAEGKVLLANPPQIPHAVLRLIVNILTVGECSGRTFQQSLALIQHLSYIPDARDVIAQELKAKAQEFGQSLYADLDELATALQSSRGDVLAGSVAAKFSPASSIQAKLLRVLKTIDYMYSSKAAIPMDEARNGGDAEKVQGIYESFRFTPLWRRLGDCLGVIETKPDTEHIATVLLPLIEALMVVCKYVGSKSASGAARAMRASASPRSPTTPKESMEDLFVSFTDAHRKVLNLMVRNNPSLMSGSFSLLVNNPRVLDFDNKRNYFTQQLHRRPHAREHHGTLQLNVRRARVFEDSFQYLQRKTGDQIKHGKLSIRFYDEEGVDAGGVTREWFQILARQMFDPNNALFQPCAADRLTYQPNKHSGVNPEHLSFFKFVGRVIGKAIYDGRLLDAYFSRSLYRQLLGKQVDYKDVEWVDPEYYNSLCWILENDPTALDLTFSVEADEFGVRRIAALKEGGETLPVTQENKREFVQLSAQYRLFSSIKDQIENLLAGFYEIIPKDLVTIFNEQELELLISGTPDIDVDEWRSATEYNGYSSSDPVIVWWWRALKSFDRDERAKVLSFATGTSRVPLSGFVDLQGVQGVQRFSIHRAYGESDRLPQAHTCFNQIDLPQYSSYEMLRQQLLLAINEGGEGFGFA